MQFGILLADSYWHIHLHSVDQQNPFTQHGVLSIVNSVLDPLGLVDHVTIQGRALLRELSADMSDWDLKQLHVPQLYTTTTLSKAMHSELCVFSDVSTKAICADGQDDVGKAELTPLCEPTIPKLELCALVLVIDMAELIPDELDVKLEATNFYCDSTVVLCYIYFLLSCP